MYFFFSSRRRHTRSKRDWSSDVCSSDLPSQARRRPAACRAARRTRPYARRCAFDSVRSVGAQVPCRSEERRVGKECRSQFATRSTNKNVLVGCGLLMLKVNRLKLPVICMLVSKWLSTLTKNQICTFFFQAEDGIRGRNVTGVQTCALPIYRVKLVADRPLAELLGEHDLTLDAAHLTRFARWVPKFH